MLVLLELLVNYLQSLLLLKRVSIYAFFTHKDFFLVNLLSLFLFELKNFEFPVFFSVSSFQ